MPYRPARPCKVRTCPGVTTDPSGYCAKHEGMKQPAAKPRDSARQKFEAGRAWRGIRSCYLSHHPLCYDCLAQGLLKESKEVHHKDGNHEHNEDENLMALCKQCHSRRTAHDHRRS